jgi:hypothetical protein
MRQSIGVLALALTAASSTTPRASRPGARSPDVITREQIAGKSFQSAYDAVEALHHNWLLLRSVTSSLGDGGAGRAPADTTRGARPQTIDQRPIDEGRSPPGMNSGIQVYLDDVRVGGVQELRRIPANTVHLIRRYTGVEAQTRFGVGHSNGVIAVSTQPPQPRQPPPPPPDR